MKVFIILGAINALLAVGLGAFGAHGLEGKIPDKYLQVWHTGVQYHMYHALGLFVVAFLADKLSGIGSVTTAGWLMFSGSLYILSVTQISILGAITPLGGVAFIISWIMIVVAAVKYL